MEEQLKILRNIQSQVNGHSVIVNQAVELLTIKLNNIDKDQDDQESRIRSLERAMTELSGSIKTMKWLIPTMIALVGMVIAGAIYVRG